MEIDTMPVSLLTNREIGMEQYRLSTIWPRDYAREELLEEEIERREWSGT